MLAPNAIIPLLSAEECEQLYHEISRYLGYSMQELLTKLFITQRQLRNYSLNQPAPGSKVLLSLDEWMPTLNREKEIVRWDRKCAS